MCLFWRRAHRGQAHPGQLSIVSPSNFLRQFLQQLQCAFISQGMATFSSSPSSESISGGKSTSEPGPSEPDPWPSDPTEGGKLPTEGGSETETGGLQEPGKAMWGDEGMRRISTKVQQHLTHCPI